MFASFFLHFEHKGSRGDQDGFVSGRFVQRSERERSSSGSDCMNECMCETCIHSCLLSNLKKKDGCADTCLQSNLKSCVFSRCSSSPSPGITKLGTPCEYKEKRKSGLQRHFRVVFLVLSESLSDTDTRPLFCLLLWNHSLFLICLFTKPFSLWYVFAFVPQQAYLNALGAYPQQKRVQHGIYPSTFYLPLHTYMWRREESPLVLPCFKEL